MAAPLATRCPACSTVFRVVPDQLRVSEGWVRCGRCTEVFDATESLVDLETGAPRLWADQKPLHTPAPQGTSGTPSSDAARFRADLRGATAVSATPDGLGVPALPESEPRAQSPGLAPLTETTSEPAPDSGPPPQPGPADALSDLPIDPRADPADTPSFARRAERAARWRQPQVRIALAAAALLGVLGLAGQFTHAYRDLAAARLPQARPTLEAACALLGCRIEAARAIDSLAVESSGLTRVERSSVYKLSVALRNRAGIELALPALDLSLTDIQGRLIARKVLLATDLGAASSTLGAGRELAMQATLQAALPATQPVAGYTVELFYP